MRELMSFKNYENMNWKTIRTFEKETTIIIFPNYFEFLPSSVENDVIWLNDDSDGFKVLLNDRIMNMSSGDGFIIIQDLETFKNITLPSCLKNEDDYELDYNCYEEIMIITLKGDVEMNYTIFDEPRKMTPIISIDFKNNYGNQEDSIIMQVYKKLESLYPNLTQEGYATIKLPENSRIQIISNYTELKNISINF